MVKRPDRIVAWVDRIGHLICQHCMVEHDHCQGWSTERTPLTAVYVGTARATETCDYCHDRCATSRQ